jgi:hypothetical protein
MFDNELKKNEDWVMKRCWMLVRQFQYIVSVAAELEEGYSKSKSFSTRQPNFVNSPFYYYK